MKVKLSSHFSHNLDENGFLIIPKEWNIDLKIVSKYIITVLENYKGN